MAILEDDTVPPAGIEPVMQPERQACRKQAGVCGFPMPMPPVDTLGPVHVHEALPMHLPIYADSHMLMLLSKHVQGYQILLRAKTTPAKHPPPWCLTAMPDRHWR